MAVSNINNRYKTQTCHFSLLNFSVYPFNALYFCYQFEKFLKAVLQNSGADSIYQRDLKINSYSFKFHACLYDSLAGTNENSEAALR